MSLLCIALWTIWSEQNSSFDTATQVNASAQSHENHELKIVQKDAQIIYTKHAKKRMIERGVNDNEVRATLLKGEQVSAKDGKSKFEKTYATSCTFKGKHYNHKEVEVVTAPNEDNDWVIITVIGDCKS